MATNRTLRGPSGSRGGFFLGGPSGSRGGFFLGRPSGGRSGFFLGLSHPSDGVGPFRSVFFSFFGSGLFGSVPPLGQQGWLFFGLTFGRQVRLFLGLSRPSYRVGPFSCIAPRENPVAKAYGRPENSEGRSVGGRRRGGQGCEDKVPRGHYSGWVS